MIYVKICPECYQSYPDTSQYFCVADGIPLSTPVAVDFTTLNDEIETQIRPAAVLLQNQALIDRPKANASAFIQASFPELVDLTRRTSRMWEHTENPTYHDNWWFGPRVADLQLGDFIVFAGALDYENQAFRIFKVPTRYLLDNLDNLDVTPSGGINIYLHMNDLVDVRNPAGLPFGHFAVN